MAYTPIRDAKEAGTIASFLGVVVDFKEAKKSQREDWVFEVTIQDDFSGEQVHGQNTMTCRVFRRWPDNFPKNTSRGDVVVLRNVKLNAWRGRLDCINQKMADSGAIVFAARTIPVPELSHAYQAGTIRLPYSDSPGMKLSTIPEQLAVMHMKKAASTASSQGRQLATPSVPKAPRADKKSLIQDMEFSRFYDVRAQVVNLYYTNRGTVELKITDYTVNTNLFYYADPQTEDADLVSDKTWKGPYGQMTLNITLYESNADWARSNLSVGDFVFLKNMRTKISPAGKLEGAVHQDKERPNQVDISKIMRHPDINEINKRKEAYEMQHLPSQVEPEAEELPVLTKKATKKKQEARLRLQSEKAAEKMELEELMAHSEAQQSGINVNVRAAYPDMKLSTVPEILDNPARKGTTANGKVFQLAFVNARYKTRVRVVDCFPPILNLFTHSSKDPFWMTEQLQQEPHDLHLPAHWEWGFYLLVEDATVPPGFPSQKVRLAVNDAAGKHLLDMDALNLKTDPLALKQLEERLFILWGNILELKTQSDVRNFPLQPGDHKQIQSKPFECYIEEYGVKRPISKEFPQGWQRMFRLDCTKILF